MKKPRTDKIDKIIDFAKKLSDGITLVGGALAQAHPIVMGLSLMGLCTLGRVLTYPETPENRNLRGELSNLYIGAQGIALASATVPVVTGGLNLLAAAMATRTGEAAG